jgi:VWFA-related protein
MSSILLSVLLLGPTGQETAPMDADVRTVFVSVTDEKGSAVEGLAREDVALLENGVARDIVTLRLDERPLTVAFLLDSSEAVRSSYRLHLLEPVKEFRAGLPEGSQFALWTVGERPTKRSDYGDDLKSLDQALKRVIPAGGSTLLDALLEATKDLSKKEGERNAVVVVTAVGPEFSSAYRERVAKEALTPNTTFLAVLLEEGATDIENRTNYEYVLERLARQSGGVFETTLSPMGMGRELQRLLAVLRGQYQLTYATVPDAKERKLEVNVARPGARVRVAKASTK